MARHNNNFFPTILIFFGMLGAVVGDTLLHGDSGTVVILLSTGLIAASLVAKMIINHEVIMESDAPGARLYQKAVVVMASMASQIPYIRVVRR